MGLALSKELVSQLDGEIGAQNNIDLGSTLWFRLPIKNKHLQTVKQALLAIYKSVLSYNRNLPLTKQ